MQMALMRIREMELVAESKPGYEVKVQQTSTGVLLILMVSFSLFSY
jgi:hypothetical protein